MSDVILTERDVLDLLHKRYSPRVGNGGIRYILAEHVKNGAGFNANRAIDLIAQDLYPSTGCALHAHEVKVSRGDWLTELKNPPKAEAFRQYCDFFWLVVSNKAIVRPGELPDGWGLLAPGTSGLRVVVGANRTAPLPMPREMQAALSRAVYKTTARRLSLNRREALMLSGR